MTSYEHVCLSRRKNFHWYASQLIVIGLSAIGQHLILEKQASLIHYPSIWNTASWY